MGERPEWERQWPAQEIFSQGDELDKVSEQEVIIATNKLNNRPRRCPDYKTPYEAFKELAGIDARKVMGYVLMNWIHSAFLMGGDTGAPPAGISFRMAAFLLRLDNESLQPFSISSQSWESVMERGDNYLDSFCTAGNGQSFVFSHVLRFTFNSLATQAWKGSQNLRGKCPGSDDPMGPWNRQIQ